VAGSRRFEEVGDIAIFDRGISLDLFRQVAQTRTENDADFGGELCFVLCTYKLAFLISPLPVCAFFPQSILPCVSGQ
jgi:hypothetical protein